MAHVVFLRAANVGGNNVFRPTELVAALRHLDVVNIGAAGTFVVRETATAAAIKKEICSRLSFEPQIAIRAGREITALVESDPFRGIKFSKDLRGWVGVLCGPAKMRPPLPIAVPAGDDWTIRFDRIDGAFTLGLSRRQPGKAVSPAKVVDKAVGAAATIRWWETIERIAKVLS